MLFKAYGFLLVTIIFTSLFAEHEGFALKAFFNDKIVQPIKSLLPAKEEHPKEENTIEADPREHGNFDSFGRDLIRETSKKFTELKESIKRTFSRDTKGLDCNKTLSTGGVDNFKSRLRAIYPGTKWCGDGNISNSYDDLGKFSMTDRCCRDHDLCPDNMDAGATKYGLINTGLFTRSHCSCDRKFYDCLKNAKSFVASSIGHTYFTVLGPQCFEEDYPVIDCLEEKRGKCLKYETAQDEERMYQWFDSPPF